MHPSDEETVPRYLLQVFERVRQNADFMPSRQVFAQMRQELGANWRDRFSDFDEKPFAAASIGQVWFLSAVIFWIYCLIDCAPPIIGFYRFTERVRQVFNIVTSLLTLLAFNLFIFTFSKLFSISSAYRRY